MEDIKKVAQQMALFCGITQEQAEYEIRCMLARYINTRTCPALTSLGITNQG